MAELKKPSLPTVTGKTVSVNTIAGAIKYTLYRVRYIFKSNFRLFDDKMLATRDGAAFLVANEVGIHKSPYMGEQLDEAVRQALGESST